MSSITEVEAPVAIVLAGGQSRRMGRDKSHCLIHGFPWVDHLLSILQQTSCDPVMAGVARPSGESRIELVDEVDGMGPLASWVTVARRFPGRRLISVPVDMPQLTLDIFEQLIDHPSGWVRAGVDDHWLLAHLTGEDLTACEAYVAQGGRSAAGFWQGRPKAQFLEFEPSNIFLNANSPADLARLDDV